MTANLTEDFSLSAPAISRVAELKNYYPQKRSAVMPILQLIQEEKGYIDQQSIVWLAGELEMSAVHVQELVTFYSMFTQEPRGKYHVQICRTLSCAIRGSRQLCETISKEYKIAPREVSTCGNFSFEQVECLGSCGTAPMCQVNDRYFENLTPETFANLLTEIKAEQPNLQFSTVSDDLADGFEQHPKSRVQTTSREELK